MIAVDSSVWIDYFRDSPTPQVELLDSYLADRASDVVLVDVVVTEVLCGLRDEHVERVEQMLLDLPVMQMRWLSDFRAAAGLYRAARKTGVTIRSTVDCMIAAVCIRERVPLLHNDADFDRLADISELSTIRVG